MVYLKFLWHSAECFLIWISIVLYFSCEWLVMDSHANEMIRWGLNWKSKKNRAMHQDWHEEKSMIWFREAECVWEICGVLGGVTWTGEDITWEVLAWDATITSSIPEWNWVFCLERLKFTLVHPEHVCCTCTHKLRYTFSFGKWKSCN